MWADPADKGMISPKWISIIKNKLGWGNPDQPKWKKTLKTWIICCSTVKY